MQELLFTELTEAEKVVVAYILWHYIFHIFKLQNNFSAKKRRRSLDRLVLNPPVNCVAMAKYKTLLINL